MRTGLLSPFALLVFHATSAFAQGGATPPALPPPTPAPAAAPAAPVTAPAPSLAAEGRAPGGYTCVVTEHEGIADAEARTIADILCHDFAKAGAPSGNYEIRIGKLGARYMLTARDPQTGEEQRLMITTVDEVPQVSQRLAQAVVSKKPVEDTLTVKNVTMAETKPERTKKGSVGAVAGINGMSGIGADSGFSGGIDVGLIFRSDRWGAVGHGRAVGVGSSDNKIGSASIDLGGRYYFSDTDTSLFVSGGPVLGTYTLNRSLSSDLSGGGFGFYGEVGVETMRTNSVGLMFSFRADLPFYSLKYQSGSRYDLASGSYVTTSGDSKYVVPISLNAYLSFR